MFSIPNVLRERASLQPNDAAFTYVDYEHDWDGVAETLTWSQLYRRTLSRPADPALRLDWGLRGHFGAAGARLHRFISRRHTGRTHRRSPLGSVGRCQR